MRTKIARTPFATALLGVATLVLALPAAHAQITVFEEVAINVTLTGQGRTPPVGTSAVGECTGRLVPATGALDLTCSSNVEGAGDVIITHGSPGPGGTKLFDVGSGAVAGAGMTLTQAEVAALLTGELYAAVTSPSHAGGEIAARLVPRTPIGVQVMRFPLRNDSLVSNGSAKTGSCLLRITANQATISLLCTHDVASPQELRVVIDGGVVSTHTNVASPFQVNLPVLASSFDRFLDGDFGVVLTSAAFPAGELGMVLDRCIEGPNTLCLNGDRFRVTMDFTAPNRGARLAGTVQARSQDSGLLYFFDPSNWEAMIKVLTACQINGNFWVFLSANTNVRFDVTVYDTLTGRTRTYSNPQGNLASPVAHTAAFSCS